MPRVTAYSHAKINLALNIVDKLPDGWHEVETVMQTLGWTDRLIFRLSTQVSLTCNLRFIPTDERNLIIRAARLLKSKTGCKQGVAVDLFKRIPVAAGLAGGSGNAAATLIALNRLWRTGLSAAELFLLGAELGTDIPYCLQGGTMLATGKGDRLTPLPNLPTGEAGPWVCVIKPRRSMSTQKAYQAVQSTADCCCFSEVLDHISRGDWRGLGRVTGNSLEAVTAAEVPVVEQIKSYLLRMGAEWSMMTGSGTAVFGLFENKEQAQRATTQGSAFGNAFYCQFTDNGVTLK